MTDQHIIDSLEKSFPERSVMPAMHYRWNFDNFQFIFDEFGRSLFPR